MTVLSGVPFIIVSWRGVGRVTSHQVMTAEYRGGGSMPWAWLPTDFKVLCRFLPAIAHDFILNGLPLVERA
jgi:hypothetical protein